MGIQDTVRRQEEKLAAQAKQPKPQAVAHPEPQPAAVDVPTMRQMIENVVRTELQALRAEQPVRQDPQPIDLQAVRAAVRAELQGMHDAQPRSQSSMVDMQAVQHTVQSVVRAELQSVQTTLTLLTKAIQAQTDALMTDDQQDEEQEQDELLPTAFPRRTDDDIEDEQVYPSDEDSDEEEIDNVGDEDEEGEEEEGYPTHPPRPESPTHRLRRPGPVGLLLGSGDSFHPSTGPRRWEPTI